MNVKMGNMAFQFPILKSFQRFKYKCKKRQYCGIWISSKRFAITSIYWFLEFLKKID